MDSMLNKNALTFKDFEKKTFEMICKAGQEYTKDFLEQYDTFLMENRDKSVYRNKGKKHTTIKTIYGEVEYDRRIYEKVREDGLKEFVYLLDEQLEIPCVGLISMNMAEQMVSSITEMSYRDTANEITEKTGQRISVMGVWNVIQKLGDKVCNEERVLVKEHKTGNLCGDKETPVLFEETDGVYIRFQREIKSKGEIKIGLAYDGWKVTGTNRYTLDNKVVVAGVSTSKEFHDFREAAIAEKYNLDENVIRIMNADGAEWVKNICDANTLFQLDPFHRNKAIRENIPYPDHAQEIYRLLADHKIDEMFEYLEKYRDSLTDDDEIERADRLITYYTNNKNGLVPYNERGIKLPESEGDLVYRNLGTMENHVWSVIAKRMKHNHTSWSKKGGNNLAKILAKKCSGRLNEVAAKLKMPVFEQEVAEQIEKKILTAAVLNKKVGKGYEYPCKASLLYLNISNEGSARKMWASFAGDYEM